MKLPDSALTIMTICALVLTAIAAYLESSIKPTEPSVQSEQRIKHSQFEPEASVVQPESEPALEEPVVESEFLKPDATSPNPVQILEIINQKREDIGIQPLEIMPAAEASAQFKADDMLSRNYFSHKDPRTRQTNGLDYLGELDGGRCQLMHENILWARGVETSAEAVEAWVGSRPHHQAIINPNFKLTGVGVAGDKIVQHFCQTY